MNKITSSSLSFHEKERNWNGNPGYPLSHEKFVFINHSYDDAPDTPLVKKPFVPRLSYVSLKSIDRNKDSPKIQTLQGSFRSGSLETKD